MGCFRGVGGAQNLKLKKMLPDSERFLWRDLAQYRLQALKNRPGGAISDCLRDHARSTGESPIEEGRDPLGECCKNRKTRSRRIPGCLLAILALNYTLDCWGFSGRFWRRSRSDSQAILRLIPCGFSQLREANLFAEFGSLSKKSAIF
jgi:hypothetical protein